MMPLTSYDIRPATPEDAAALFVVHAAIVPTDAGQMLEWVTELEERLETGGRGWIAARGRRLAGHALIDPVPGLPGAYDLTGGIVPARRRQGLGSRLLRHVQTAAGAAGVKQLSCRVDHVDEDGARFLLSRGFYVEHEECLLELDDLAGSPPVPESPTGDLKVLPASRVTAEFCRVYDASFAGRPWSQPYSEAEVAAMLAGPDDMLFAVVDGEPVGVVWHEMLPGGRGRVEPIGIVEEFQGQGYGRKLLVAALHNLRRRGASLIEIALWRENTTAMHLYKSLGFTETGNWYYLAWDVDGLKAE